LGCSDAPDDLIHYAKCPVIIRIVKQITGTSDEWPGLDWLGLFCPSEFALHCIAAMFYGYHAVKFASPSICQTHQSDSETPTFYIHAVKAHEIFAGAFAAAASASGVTCRPLRPFAIADFPDQHS